MSDNDDTNPKDRLGVKKPSLFYIPKVAILMLGYAFAEGARKYGAFNWRRKKVKRSVYIDAIYRHLIALESGEDIDGDTIIHDAETGEVIFPGIPHEAKIMACCALMIDAKRVGCLIDDRFELDTSAAYLAERTSGDYHAAAAALTLTPARTLDELRGAA